MGKTLVRKLNPQAYTVGEFWDNARQHLVDGRFSAAMNDHGFAYLVKGFLIDGQLTAHVFCLQLQQRREAYPPAMQFALQNLIDSHDTDRVASMIDNDWQFPHARELQLEQVFRVADNRQRLAVKREAAATIVTIPALDAVVFAESAAQQ